jgi:hypothetical protein
MSSDDDPMGADYWKHFEAMLASIESDRRRRDAQYGELGDPATGGWGRARPADEQAGCATPPG